ncbi:MAG: hypothetical protein IJB81_02655 [Clostridia bacterium]|nr:hypothetical protein [Clostridia bacterium]
MKRLFEMLLAALLLLPAAVAETGVRYIDGGNADRVHLRAAPSAQADSKGLYFTGTGVILIDNAGDWAWVMIGDESGYVMTEYLTREEPVSCAPWYVVDNPSSTWVNLRMSPRLDGMVALRPENGTAVRLLGETAEGWSHVACEGVTGYIMTSLISPIGETAETQRTTILSDATGEGYIHQYTAPNGQAIYFTADLEHPYITLEDVNFDGLDDIVILTFSGASNGWYKFFVYDAAKQAYVYVHQYGDDAGLVNYETYPEYGLIGARASNGNAGLLHVWNLYRWEGTDLRLIRSAVSDEWSEDVFDGQTYTSIIHGDMLHVVVRDHTKDYDVSVLWELILPKEDAMTRDIFTEEQEALWQGIR